VDPTWLRPTRSIKPRPTLETLETLGEPGTLGTLEALYVPFHTASRSNALRSANFLSVSTGYVQGKDCASAQSLKDAWRSTYISILWNDVNVQPQQRMDLEIHGGDTVSTLPLLFELATTRYDSNIH
jgi:hypothetical protein